MATATDTPALGAARPRAARGRGPVACATSPSAPASARRCSRRSSAARRARRWPSPTRIAAGLELRLSPAAAPRRGRRASPIVRAARAPQRPADAAATRYEVLTPPLPGQRAEVSRHVLAAGRAHRRRRRPADARARQPRDRRRRARRRRRSCCDGERHELAEGDCVTFDADLPHHFENPGAGAAALLAVVSRRPAEELTRCPRRCSTRSGRPTRSRRACSTSTCTSSTR